MYQLLDILFTPTPMYWEKGEMSIMYLQILTVEALDMWSLPGAEVKQFVKCCYF